VHYGLCSTKLGEYGKITDWEWFDETRLTMISPSAVTITFGKKEKTGGPSQECPIC